MRIGRPPTRTKEYWQEYNRQYRLANKERLSAYRKAWRRVHKDHTTGAVRGLLCIGCNTTVGKLRDSPELIEKIRRYLYRHAQLRLVV